MRQFISILLLVVLCQVSHAQRKGRFVAIIKTINNESIKVPLLGATDSTISISGRKDSVIDVSIKIIRSVKVRRHSAFGRGMWPGLGAGVALGFIIGYASYSDPCAGNSGFICIDFGPGFPGILGAIIGAPIGMVTGGAIATQGKTYPIDQQMLHPGIRLELETYVK